MKKNTTKKLIYSKSLGDALARAARRSRSDRFHVIANNGKWSLVYEGSIKPVKVFSTKNEAISFARRTQTKQSLYSGKVIIHSKDGRVQNTISL